MADDGLHYGIEPAFRSVEIPRDLGFGHLRLEEASLDVQWHVVLEAIGSNTSVTRHLQSVRIGHSKYATTENPQVCVASCLN